MGEMRAFSQSLIFLSLSSLALSVQAKPSVKRGVLSFTEKKISFNSSKLPPFCLGNDPQLIVRSLSRQIPDKGEFETTPQYERRMDAENMKPLIGGLTVKDDFATALDHYGDNEEGIPIVDYDADAEQFSVRINISSKGVGTDSKVDQPGSVCIKHFKVKRGLYRGDQGESIEKEDGYWFYMTSPAFAKFHDPSSEYDFTNATFKFPCKLQIAKRIKPNLRIMVFYRLAEPGLVKERRRVWPTSYYRVNGWTNDFYLNANIVGLWVYDVKTVTVLWKFPIPFQSPQLTQQQFTGK